MSRAAFFNIVAIAIFLLGVAYFVRYTPFNSPTTATPQDQKQLSAAVVSQAASSTAIVATSSPATTTTATVVHTQIPKRQGNKAIISAATTSSDEVARIENPYSSDPESFDDINVQARSAIVNILCQPNGSSSLNPISGSGVIIDPRGIVLTNAHVAQFVLLSESPHVDLSCTLRTGSPAKATWTAVVLYIPPIWVAQHASEIAEQHPTGTGEHDYALLFITGSVDGSPLPPQFPYLQPDTRPAIGFPGDSVLIASYPAEFLGGIGAQYGLYADTSITAIKELLTFGADTPDVLSLGGVIEAQSGSSGGAVVNAWGRLVGLIATTSTGTTTADRDLRAESLSYINTDLAAQSGSSLTSLLAGDPATEVSEFTDSTADSLIQQYVSVLSSNQAVQ